MSTYNQTAMVLDQAAVDRVASIYFTRAGEIRATMAEATAADPPTRPGRVRPESPRAAPRRPPLRTGPRAPCPARQPEPAPPRRARPEQPPRPLPQARSISADRHRQPGPGHGAYLV